MWINALILLECDHIHEVRYIEQIGPPTVGCTWYCISHPCKYIKPGLYGGEGKHRKILEVEIVS
jgi:hypothetical protein